MIKSFKSKEAEKIFNRACSLKLPFDIQRTALRKLLMIHAAIAINDLRIPPANRLEQLKGVRRGQHSIRINDQWRICFVWQSGDAYEVEVEDYH
jgi:toxin HigB-1